MKLILKTFTLIYIISLASFLQCGNKRYNNNVSSSKEIIKGTDIYIYDYEKILTTKEKDTLTKILLNYKNQTTKEILVVTTHSIGSFSNMKAYARNLGNVYSGEEKEKNIIIVAVSKKLGELTISTSDNARKIITDDICENIIYEKMIPNFKKGNFFDGIKKAVEELIVKWSN